MSWTLGQVRLRVLNLLDDPQGTYITPDFVNPLINEVYEDMNSRLASAQSSEDVQVVEIAGVPPGTPNLAGYQTSGAPLGKLMAQPERIDWKAAGDDASYYQLVPNYNVLPDFQPQQGIAGWEYRESTIWLAPASIAVDLRVRGEFGFPDLVKDADVLRSHPRIGYAVAYATAALIAAVRGNLAWVAQYDAKAMEALDEIMSQLVRMEQGEVRRIGRETQNGRCGPDVWATR